MILVTGASGNVGGEVVARLAADGRPARALVRDPQRAELPEGVEAVAGDLARPESLGPALEGASGVFLLGGFADMPGGLAAIRDAGVGRVVLLSSRSVIGGVPGNAVVDMWNASEDAVRASGVAWTILRPSGFMSNALRWADQARAGDVVRAPFADAAVASIDPYDIAAVAVAALSDDAYASRELAITGPEALWPADEVRVVARVLGRDLRFEATPDDEARAEMEKTSPPAFVDAFFRFFVDGEFDDSTVLPTVRDVTGREPRAFDQWVRAHADAFR